MNAIALAPPPLPPAARRVRMTKTPPPLKAEWPQLEGEEWMVDKPGPSSRVSDKTLVIVARANVGWGNTLYLRGEGGCLSWDVGVPMINTGEDRWVWSCHADNAPREFKFLLNDSVWANGGNQVMSGADITVCSPAFTI